MYNRAMLQGVDGWYRVEDTPPSKVRETFSCDYASTECIDDRSKGVAH